MGLLACLFLGFAVATVGSITPSFLNMTVVKFSLNRGRTAAFYLIAGFATVLFFQANLGAYLSNVLMENSEYITAIQKLGTAILLLLSINFFRLHFTSRNSVKKVETDKSQAYLHGVGMSLLNTFAIPFYFTTLSLLIALEYFKYSIENSVFFSIGSTLGSFCLYALYAIVASKIEHKLTFIATKMNLVLAGITGVVGLGNLIYLLK